MRTYDVNVVTEATRLYAEEIVGFDPVTWLQNPLNLAFVNEVGDVTLLENQRDLPNTACAHYFFKSRGKEAIKTGQEFMKEVFETTYVERIVGLTPVEHKAARWMNRKLGLKELGYVETEVGPCVFVLITKDQWKELGK